MKQVLQLQSLDELNEVAKQLLVLIGERKIVAMHAPMGAGKTTLIKALCTQLGSQDSFSSPTFSIINEYQIVATGKKIFHLDLYRLKNLDEAIQAGVDDCLSGEHYCFIEWPELIVPILPVDAVQLSISLMPDGARQITIFDSDTKS